MDKAISIVKELVKEYEEDFEEAKKEQRELPQLVDAFSKLYTASYILYLLEIEKETK